MLIKYIVYITYDLKTIQVKWIIVFVFHTSYIQTLDENEIVNFMTSGAWFLR